MELNRISWERLLEFMGFTNWFPYYFLEGVEESPNPWPHPQLHLSRRVLNNAYGIQLLATARSSAEASTAKKAQEEKPIREMANLVKKKKSHEEDGCEHREGSWKVSLAKSPHLGGHFGGHFPEVQSRVGGDFRSRNSQFFQEAGEFDWSRWGFLSFSEIGSQSALTSPL